MAANSYAEFLKPFELALRKVDGDDEMIKGVPIEVRKIAQEVVVEIQKG
ncbi:MAG: hypothetical protein HRT35_11705 [Algicola sp.]|nr:hypothetical protein [Algicola sp.]